MSERTDSVREALRRRYCWPKYCYIEEAANGTGSHRGRLADGLALAVWPSSGLWLYGFEIKVQRSDLLRELRDRQKWRAVGRYCDYWWLVVAAGVWRKTDDIPAAWGVMEALPGNPHAGSEWQRMDQLVPRRRPRRQESEPLDRPFIAAILRDGVRHGQPTKN
ncbi:hypothetical protein LCGC14_1560660 [marine sediment metagenome]|uniref:Uncharacterized protein n=1 Tax=marine sediment metagenome TaxID=412755 RepID=A0A0F9J8K8_9ZZZZ